MDIKKLQKLVVDALEDVKAQDIRLYDTTHLTSMFDRIVIASGTSNRQTKALAASVRDKVKEAGGKIVSMEGENTGEWVLVDLGDMVVHIMQPTIRAYYHLEDIWGEKPINLAARKRAPRKTPSQNSTAAKTPASKTAAAKPAAKTAAKKVPAKKTAASKTTAASKPKAPARKVAAKKVVAKKTVTKKTAAKKTPASKKSAK